MICSHCKHKYRGNYCSHCGKKSEIDRLNTNLLLIELYTQVKQLTILFFNTFIKLSYQAPLNLRTYLFKDRSNFLSAFEYMLFAGTLVTILTLKFNFFLTGFNQVETESFSFISESTAQFLNDFFLYTEEYPTLINVLAIPCFVFCSYLFFYHEHLSFGEHIIINTYITAQQTLLLLLTIPFLLFFPQSKEFLINSYIVIITLYNVWVYYGLFLERSKLYTFLKVIMCILLAYLLQFILNLSIYYCIEPYKYIIDQIF